MIKEVRCKSIRNSLFSAISKVASVPENCVRKPGIDFTRNRKLPLSTMLLMLIGMGGGSLMNLEAKEFPLERIKELYYRRWGIETSFRELKYAIGLASLHGKKKEFML